MGSSGNLYSCVNRIEINKLRSEAGSQGKPWFMYQHNLISTGVLGSEGIGHYPLAEKKKNKGKQKGRKKDS